jgi:hypothetical protein
MESNPIIYIYIFFLKKKKVEEDIMKLNRSMGQQKVNKKTQQFPPNDRLKMRFSIYPYIGSCTPRLSCTIQSPLIAWAESFQASF